MRSIYIRRAFVVAFVLNAIWEVAQLPAFAGLSKLPLIVHVVGLGVATLLDGLFIAGVYLTASWWSRDARWMERRHLPAFVYATVLGAVTATIVEWLAVSGGWWSYSEAMPLVPWTEVGLLPFIQLTSLTPLTLWLVGRWWKVTD